jgi:hypothetical protein
MIKHPTFEDLDNPSKRRKLFVFGKFVLFLGKETYSWATEINGKYGVAITFWKRPYSGKRFHYGMRISLLLGHKRPFTRLTTYSCPSIGSEGVKPLDCVVPMRRK